MLTTSHRILLGDARELTGIADGAVHLVVTSPPYPMVEMWDQAFTAMVPGVEGLLTANQGFAAFEAMHGALDRVWAECFRVLRPGGFACVNIGDATRSLAGEFALYPNHARIVTAMVRLGFTPLPDILWRKPTNAPNKFMGSGMLPAGAYVTYEHEYILVFRKGGKRAFSAAEQEVRSQSAYFWEERNLWFSDLWTGVTGTKQSLGGPRERSAAFPYEIPYRLILMYSLQGDVVLDPFVGTGTTMAAAIGAGRSSVGVERIAELHPFIQKSLEASIQGGRERLQTRIADHNRAMVERESRGDVPKHRALYYDFPVVTRQELGIYPLEPVRLHAEGSEIRVEHEVLSASRAAPAPSLFPPSVRT